MFLFFFALLPNLKEVIAGQVVSRDPRSGMTQFSHKQLELVYK